MILRLHVYMNSSVPIARKVWWLLTPAERRRALALLLLMFVGMVLETLGIGLVVPMIALLTANDSRDRFPVLGPVLAALGNPRHELVVTAAMLGLVGVYLIKTFYLAFLVWLQSRFAYGIHAQLSQRLFTTYLRQPYAFHLHRNSAQLLRNVTGEVHMFTNGAMMPGMLLVSEALVLLGLFVLLLAVEPVGAVLVVGFLGITGWGFHRATHARIARWGLARQHHEGLRIQHLQQGLGGAKDVKLLGRETEFLEQYRVHNAQSARAGQLQYTVQQLPRLWLELLAVNGLAALVLSMLWQGRAVEAVLPTLGLFAATAFRLMPSVNRSLNSLNSLRYALPVVNTLYAESRLPTSESEDSKIVTQPFRQALELDKVTFTYAGATVPALSDLSLIVRRGESVGFVGTSGAGKSTLVDVLLGLLVPISGEVRVDGRNIHADIRNWQNQIGYVPQSIFLTDDTLRRNVAFGLSDDQIDDAAVWRTIHAAQMDEFVRSLPHGLETRVGERGVRLSGGQRQRIGIARALYHDPAILVMDEATSSLDPATERDVMRAVMTLHGEKTIVLVAHRLTTVEYCDRLYRLERGKVVEEGTPGSMLATKKTR